MKEKPAAPLVDSILSPQQAVLWREGKPPFSSLDYKEKTIRDRDKRAFLKTAGLVSAGVATSMLLPKRADALILGSSPTTGVVGVKDVDNARINPATEETLSSLLKPSDLTFDGGSLDVKVTSMPDGGASFSNSEGVAQSALVDENRHVQVDVLNSVLPTSASTEDTLQTISFGGFKFSIRLEADSVDPNIEYVGEAAIGTATSAAAWRIKRIDSTTGVITQWAAMGTFDQIWDNRESLDYS